MNIFQSNKKAMGKILVYEVIGFLGILFLIWANEMSDLPALIFGMQVTPVNWVEIILESLGIILLAIFVITMTARHLNRIKYLEGFLSICASCKKIHDGDEWVMFEQFFNDRTGAIFSHGLCPDCADKFFEEGAEAKKKHRFGISLM